MTQLELAQKDPSQAFKAAAAVKLLSLAAAGLERLHNLKWTALGMNRDSVVADALRGRAGVLKIECLLNARPDLLQTCTGCGGVRVQNAVPSKEQKRCCTEN